MKKMLLLLCLICLPTAALANFSPYVGIPGDAIPMKQPTQVRMVRERIDIKMYWNWENPVEVKCFFVFRNEGKAAKVQMGFPERSENESSIKSEFKYFKAWVDGKPVKTTYIPGARPNKRFDGDYINWHVHNVDFAANQTRTVRCEYAVDSQELNFFKYILRTGRDWKGNIGESVIVLDASSANSFAYINAYPKKGRSIQNGIVTWRFKDFEPAEDIEAWLEQKRMIFFGQYPGGTSDPRIDRSGSLEAFQLPIADLEMFGRTGIILVEASALKDRLPVGHSWTYTFNGELIHNCEAKHNQDDSSKDCTFQIGTQYLTVHLGSKKAILNGVKTVYLDHAPYRTKYGSILIPLFSIVKPLGCTVVEDSSHHCFIVKLPSGLKIRDKKSFKVTDRSGVGIANLNLLATVVPGLSIKHTAGTNIWMIMHGKHSLNIRANSKEAVLDNHKKIRLPFAPSRLFRDPDQLRAPVVTIARAVRVQVLWDKKNPKNRSHDVCIAYPQKIYY